LAGERLEWRLVAVLTADVAGLIGEDEEGTLALLNSERRFTI